MQMTCINKIHGCHGRKRLEFDMTSGLGALVSGGLDDMLRHDICQKIYKTRFSKATLLHTKARKLQLFSLTKKQHKFTNVSDLGSFLL